MTFWKHRIFADAAAGTPLSHSVKRELTWLLDVYGNPGGLHKEGVAAKNIIEDSRDTIAKTIGAHSDEIFFTASGTEANNLALTGILRPLLQKGLEVNAITSVIEHSSILAPLEALEKEGMYVAYLPVDQSGLVNPKELRERINDQTALISIQLVNSEIGTIQPIREIAKEIRKIKKERTNGLPLYFHVDASQAPLWISFMVENLGVDLLTLDAQKIMGPKGIGALYAKRGTDLEPIIFGGSQESGFRAGTENTPLIGAFALALKEAQDGAEARAARVSEIRNYCFTEIKKLLSDAVLNGAPLKGERVANNINVSIPNLEAQMAVIALDAEGIAASTRSACDIGDEEPSAVIQAIGVPKEMAGTAIRITFLPGITQREASRIAHALAEIAKRYKKVV